MSNKIAEKLNQQKFLNGGGIQFRSSSSVGSEFRFNVKF